MLKEIKVGRGVKGKELRVEELRVEGLGLRFSRGLDS